MCLFCEFISGKRRRHTNGLPFRILNETDHTLSFLSIDFPDHEDGHILVVPKKHYMTVEEIPKYILHDLIEHVALASKVVKENHAACNVLLNNGKAAGQCIFHLHFHIVPRDDGDRIRIEVWNRKDMQEKEFRKLIVNLRSRFRKKR
ncbi:MAG: HIT family protein [Nanoarchaeota archaeon]